MYYIFEGAFDVSIIYKVSVVYHDQTQHPKMRSPLTSV